MEGQGMYAFSYGGSWYVYLCVHFDGFLKICGEMFFMKMHNSVEPTQVVGKIMSDDEDVHFLYIHDDSLSLTILQCPEYIFGSGLPPDCSGWAWTEPSRVQF
ncbi:hypothetical protein AMTRI_Chr08g202540 [Amborella trichopoda]